MLKWVTEDDYFSGDGLGPSHEEGVENALLSRLKPGDLFVDVGAHVGHYTVRAAAIGCWVIAVEPNPACAARLKENLELNELRHWVTIEEVAAWHEMEYLELRSGKDRDGSRGTAPVTNGRILGLALDDVIGEKLPTAIKIDTEGSELQVLTGLSETLARCHPLLFIEDHSIWGAYAGGTLEKWLEEHDYNVEPIEWKLPWRSIPYILAEWEK